MRIVSYIAIASVVLLAACGGKKGGSSDGGSGEEPGQNVPQTGNQPNSTDGGSGSDPVVPLPNDGGGTTTGGTTDGGTTDGGGSSDGGTPTTAKIHFAKGFLVTRFPGDVSTQGNFQGWNPTLRPSRVANGSVLTTDYVVKTVERE